MKKTIPAISIIIPMYNVEKYVGECLDSILAQTFDDYEVIVVDDCSTDHSRDIVEGYIPKFNRVGVEKLQLIRLQENSGSDAKPRNVGIRFAQGKYVFFMDSDDAIINDAMAVLFNNAEKFNVDVVYCEKFYQAYGNTVTTDKRLLKVFSYDKVEFISKPTFISDSIENRVLDIGTHKIIGFPWNRLIKRDLIVKNDIEFPLTRCGNDHIFSFFVICLAKNILRIPDPLYVWRRTPTGVTFGKVNPEKHIHRWTDSLFRGIGIMDKFMDKFEIFNKKPELKQSIFETLIYYHAYRVLSLYAQIPAWQLDEFVRKELDEIEDKTALTAFLFAKMNLLTLNNYADMNKTSEVMQKATKVIQNQQEIIQNQAAQIKSLQSQLSNVK